MPTVQSPLWHHGLPKEPNVAYQNNRWMVTGKERQNKSRHVCVCAYVYICICNHYTYILYIQLNYDNQMVVTLSTALSSNWLEGTNYVHANNLYPYQYNCAMSFLSNDSKLHWILDNWSLLPKLVLTWTSWPTCSTVEWWMLLSFCLLQSQALLAEVASFIFWLARVQVSAAKECSKDCPGFPESA